MYTPTNSFVNMITNSSLSDTSTINSTNVVSPSTKVNVDTNTTISSCASSSNSKIMLKNILIHNDISLHNRIGEQVLSEVFKIAEARGYDECFGHKKKGPFIKSINLQLHDVDGPLSHIKMTADATFQKKVNQGIEVLDKLLDMSHSDEDGHTGEDWPIHLIPLMETYKQMRESSTLEGRSEDRSAINLATQLSLIPNMNHTNVNGPPRHSSHAKNAKEGHAVITRGNNSHDASSTAIVLLKETPSFKQCSVPNVGILLQKTKQGAADFQSVADQMRLNSIAREGRIKAHQQKKRAFNEDQLSHIKTMDDRKITIMDRHVDYKIKKQKVELITRKIEMARQDIVMFKDDNEMRSSAIQRLHEYYTELNAV